MMPFSHRRALSIEGSLTHAWRTTNNVLHSKAVIISQVSLLANATGILLLLSVILGPLRRRSKSASVKAILFASYTMTAYLIAYAMSLMLHPRSYLASEGTGVIWALLLLIAFASVDSFCAYSLLDHEQWRRYNWQFALKVWVLMILIYPYYTSFTKLAFAEIIVLFVAVLLKVHSKNQSLAASSRYALEKSNKFLLDYMIMEQKAMDMSEIDPLSMKGYRYLLQGEEYQLAKGFSGNDQVVTLERVWNCDGKLLSSDNDRCNLIKDLCLSFSLFKILRLTYVGYKLPQEVHEKMAQLIQYGLLEHKGSDYHERVFRVMEDELAFLFDSFYTKFHVIFHPKRYSIRIAEFLIISVVTSFLILGFVMLVTYPSAYTIEGRSITSWEKKYFYSALISVATFILVEIAQFRLLRYTRWAKIANVCEYVKYDSWRKSKRKEKRVDKICRLRSPQPWERKLHQYSLLKHYTYRPSKLLSNKFTSMFIKWDRDGQKQGSPLNLSGEVKKAVFDRIKDICDSRLENGIASLRRHDMMNLLVWACELETQTKVIMTWHIATAICEVLASPTDSEESRRNVRVATSLSKYMAYLVGFEPRLLPDHPYVTESLFDQMITDARHLFKGCKKVEKRIEKLREIPRRPGHEATSLGCGAVLGNIMLDDIGEPNRIWAILADFWVETVLYVAPSKDATAHVEQLANGGEFVTHLWAFLYHAGIKREKRYQRSG